jgi:beta-carotene hydroxylase
MLTSEERVRRGPQATSEADTHPPVACEPEPPSLETLGEDLLITTARQRWLSLARPFGWIGIYAAAAAAGWWWLTPLSVFMVFVAVVTVTHDVVHNTLGLSRKGTEWALFLLGALLLESGHSYRASHHQHHRVFPGPDDPEGDPARLTLRGAILTGPLFLPRLGLWAFRRSRGQAGHRRWLIVEAAVPFLVLTCGLLSWRTSPGILCYAVMVITGSWVYPLLTVHLPHKDYGATPLTQTRTLRGRIIPTLFLELTYHLEHHLYPQVPSHNLARLAQGLDPFFQAAGVKPWKVP